MLSYSDSVPKFKATKNARFFRITHSDSFIETLTVIEMIPLKAKYMQKGYINPLPLNVTKILLNDDKTPHSWPQAKQISFSKKKSKKTQCILIFFYKFTNHYNIILFDIKKGKPNIINFYMQIPSLQYCPHASNLSCHNLKEIKISP